MRRSPGAPPGQMLLDGFEPAAEPTDNVFFALLPDDEMARRLAMLAEALRRQHRLSGRPLRTERFHVSLVGFPLQRGVPADLLALARRMADAVRCEVFDVRFDRALSFGGRSARAGLGELPYVLRGAGGNEDVVRLADALGALPEARIDHSRITPHLTLLYDKQIVAEHEIEPLGWTVREFVLIRNRLRTGLPYELLGRWPLAGA